MSDSESSTRERDQQERKTLEDALNIASGVVDAAAEGQHTVLAARDVYTLAAGFLVLAGDMAAMLDAAKPATHFCGWCQQANGDSRTGLRTYTLDEVREHTVRCEHNPLVQTVARLQRAAPVVLTVMALLAGEADLAGLRDVVTWYEKLESEHLEIWLNAERARKKNDAREVQP